MPTPKPQSRPRPVYGHLRVGKSLIKFKIDWDAYEEERAKTGKVPTHFTVWGFSRSYRVARDRIKFEASK